VLCRNGLEENDSHTASGNHKGEEVISERPPKKERIRFHKPEEQRSGPMDIDFD